MRNWSETCISWFRDLEA